MKSPLEIGDVVVVNKGLSRDSYGGISWDKRIMGRYIGRLAHVVGVYELPHQHDAYILAIDNKRLQFGGEDILWIPHWLDYQNAVTSDHAPSSYEQAANEIIQAQNRLQQALSWLGA